MAKKKKRKKSTGTSRIAIAALFSYALTLLKNTTTILLLLVLGFFTWLKYTGEYYNLLNFISNNTVELQKNSGLVLKNILLDGHKYTPKDDIIKAITESDNIGNGTDKNTKVKVQIGTPILSINLWRIKENLEKLTWIKQATVTRQLPSTLSITMIERQPFALWQNQGNISLIDSDGEIIAEKNLKDFSNLIVLVGSEVPTYAASFLKFINISPKITPMVASAVLINGRRWNVKLRNGILIKLPEDNPEKAWKYLVDKQEETRLLESNIKVIDLRLENKMVVKP